MMLRYFNLQVVISAKELIRGHRLSGSCLPLVSIAILRVDNFRRKSKMLKHACMHGPRPLYTHKLAGKFQAMHV